MFHPDAYFKEETIRKIDVNYGGILHFTWDYMVFFSLSTMIDLVNALKSQLTLKKQVTSIWVNYKFENLMSTF